MIIIIAKSVVKDERLEEYKVLAKKLVEESQKEAGCISYNLYQDINNKNVLTFIEEWKDKEAIALHNSSVHFATIVPKFVELRESSEVNLYEKI